MPHNSEVLKLLREQEANLDKAGVAGMSPLQENRQYRKYLVALLNVNVFKNPPDYMLNWTQHLVSLICLANIWQPGDVKEIFNVNS